MQVWTHHCHFCGALLPGTTLVQRLRRWIRHAFFSSQSGQGSAPISQLICAHCDAYNGFDPQSESGYDEHWPAFYAARCGRPSPALTPLPASTRHTLTLSAQEVASPDSRPLGGSLKATDPLDVPCPMHVFCATCLDTLERWRLARAALLEPGQPLPATRQRGKAALQGVGTPHFEQYDRELQAIDAAYALCPRCKEAVERQLEQVEAAVRKWYIARRLEASLRERLDGVLGKRERPSQRALLGPQPSRTRDEPATVQLRANSPSTMITAYPRFVPVKLLPKRFVKWIIAFMSGLTLASVFAARGRRFGCFWPFGEKLLLATSAAQSKAIAGICFSRVAWRFCEPLIQSGRRLMPCNMALVWRRGDLCIIAWTISVLLACVMSRWLLCKCKQLFRASVAAQKVHAPETFDGQLAVALSQRLHLSSGGKAKSAMAPSAPPTPESHSTCPPRQRRGAISSSSSSKCAGAFMPATPQPRHAIASSQRTLSQHSIEAAQVRGPFATSSCRLLVSCVRQSALFRAWDWYDSARLLLLGIRLAEAGCSRTFCCSVWWSLSTSLCQFLLLNCSLYGIIGGRRDSPTTSTATSTSAAPAAAPENMCADAAFTPASERASLPQFPCTGFAGTPESCTPRETAATSSLERQPALESCWHLRTSWYWWRNLFCARRSPNTPRMIIGLHLVLCIDVVRRFLRALTSGSAWRPVGTLSAQWWRWLRKLVTVDTLTLASMVVLVLVLRRRAFT